MRLKLVYCVTAIVTIGIAASLLAQQPQGQPGGRSRGGPPGGFGGGFTSRMALLGIAEVRKELELAEEQIDEIEKVSRELREKYPFGGRGGQGGRGGDGRRGPAGNNNNNQGSRVAPAQWYFVQARAENQTAQEQRGQERGGRGNFPQFTDEQRAEFEKQRLERAREEKARLAEILLPHQLKRLNEIFIQRAGLLSALQDEDTAKELGISDSQKAKLTEVRRANEEAFGALMRERIQGGGGGDPEAVRARFDEVRKAGEAKLLAVLTPDQQKKLEDLKGKPFAFPEGEGRFAPGGGNRGGNRNRGGNNN